jgi:hypothetical protein
MDKNEESEYGAFPTMSLSQQPESDGDSTAPHVEAAPLVGISSPGVFIPESSEIFSSTNSETVLESQNSRTDALPVTASAPLLFRGPERPNSIMMPLKSSLPANLRVQSLTMREPTGMRQSASLPSASSSESSSESVNSSDPFDEKSPLSLVSKIPPAAASRLREQAVEKELDIVMANTLGLFSVHCYVMSESLLIATKSTKRGLVFLGLIELAHSDISGLPLPFVEAALSQDGRSILVGKYKSWLRLRHQQTKEYLFSSRNDSDLWTFHTLMRQLIDKCTRTNFRILLASPKPAPRGGHTCVRFLLCLHDFDLD